MKVLSEMKDEYDDLAESEQFAVVVSVHTHVLAHPSDTVSSHTPQHVSEVELSIRYVSYPIRFSSRTCKNSVVP